MLKSKKIMSLILAATMTFGLVGCGGSGDGKTSGNGKKEIVFWSPFTGPDQANMNELVKQYNDTNPEYKVKHVPMTDLYTKVTTTVQSGKDVPGLTVIHGDRVQLLADEKMITPLDEALSKNGNIKADNYVKNAWNLGNYNDSQFTVPLDVHSWVIYYNKDLLEKYGPNVLDDGVLTLDEVKAVGEKAKADKITTIGLTWFSQQVMSHIFQAGSDVTDGTKPVADTETIKEILNTYKDLVASKIASQDGDDPGQLFRSGQLVFLPEGVWMLNSLKDIPNLNFGMTNHMSIDANKGPKNHTGSHQFAMLKNDNRSQEEIDGAMKFVEWVGDNSLEWAKSGQNPASLKILENEEYKKMPQAVFMENTEAMAINPYKYSGYLWEALDKIVFEVAFGRMSAEDAVKAAQKEIDGKMSMVK